MKDWTILDSLKNDNRDVLGSVIALTGPQRPLLEIEGSLKENFEKVYTFFIPDDYGQFPDTMGYTSKNWENLESDMEDPALFPYMTKCVDAVVDFNNKRVDTLAKLNYSDVESYLHSPKFGGATWACIGIIRAYAPSYINKSRGIIIH